MRHSRLLLLPLCFSLLACNSKGLEQALAPDPKLITSPSPVTPSPSPTTATPSPQAGLGGYTDLDSAPEQLRPYIDDLLKLELLQRSCNPAPCTTFQPNQAILRREYARWLVDANNRFYSDVPTKQIRLAVETAEPVFTDVPKTDPDFAAIQGLAEAGLIPSQLSNQDKTAKTFQPDAPLTRADLMLWKVPLDIRTTPPNKTIAQVSQRINFQDIQTIPPDVLNAVFADAQNGDNANFQRAFGYTTIFQPKRKVTRAEASAVLWHFGTQTDGLSAPVLLKPTTASPSTPTSPSTNASPESSQP